MHYRVLAVLALVACSSAPAATTDFWGPTIEPPRGLGKLAPGMSVADAIKLVPALHEPKARGVRDELILDSGVGDVKLAVRVEAGTVSSILAIVQNPSVRDLLTRAWGQPEITRDSLGQPEVTWASEATGWKVKLDCMERNCLVEYVPYHVLTAEFFGPHVVPPGDLGKLRIGMPLAEARTLAPGPVSARSGIATKYDGVREFVAIDDKQGTVRSIYLNLPEDAVELITAAWGDGAAAAMPVGKAVEVWHDPETGWRATLRPALGRSRDLVFDIYMPAFVLFGDQPDTLEGLREPVLGRSVDDVKKAYKDVITAQGRDLVVSLPPTEWDRFATRILLDTSGGRVRSLSFAIPFKPHPQARDQLLDLFKGKWGLPEEVVEDSKPTLVFRKDDPRVEIREDNEHGAWLVEIR
ncbi:MAG TPA: hypothetical protein VFV99_16540 [Kofleriaceae bacterium]|nr:hypothetical protein [Kofleriaceae bacterium]